MTAVLAVAQRGAGILTLVAAPVTEAEYNSEWLQALVSSMQTTMLERQGVGIAAPQIYVSKRVIIVASRPNSRYPDAPEMPAIAMINPEMIDCSEQQFWGEEGCLSVPEQRAQVARAAEIRVRFHNVNGEVFEQTFTGFPARIVQHEIDHLNGILFVDRIAENPLG